MGGEKNALVEFTRFSMGSPPRGRGKVLVKAAYADWLGITPAWAGKNWRTSVTISEMTDYPC